MKKTFIIIFKIVITLIVVFYLGDRIFEEWDMLLTALKAYLTTPIVLLAVLLLMPVNWLIEALKWKISIKSLVKISWFQAIRGVLAGISLGFVTPHAIGDYFARIWTISHQDRKQAIGPIMLNRIAQLIPTAVFGGISLLFIYDKLKLPGSIDLLDSPTYLVVLGFLLLVLLLFLFNKYGKHFKKVKSYFIILRSVPLSDYFKLILLSFLRYSVFSFQFIILLSIFKLDLSLSKQFLGIAFIFLSKSVLPTFNFLNDLGVREFSAVIYFDVFNIDTSPVILASLLLWIINIVFPAVLGLLYIRKFKIDLA